MTLSSIPTSREQLWALLAEAAEIEHHLMCCYLYAAFSLKQQADEGLSCEDLPYVLRWRQEILGVAIEEMGHLAMVCNILSAIGAPAHLAHQNFPIAPGYHPAGVVVKLTPFNPSTLQHFIFLERPEDHEVADGSGFEPPQTYRRLTNMNRLMTVGTDYVTVGQLYAIIGQGMKSLTEKLGEKALFSGNPEHQLDEVTGRLPGLKVVRCLATAQQAVDAIVRQGEGAAASEERSHYQRFIAIQQEYDSLVATRHDFRPAYAAAENPVMRIPPTPEGRIWVNCEPASSLIDLGNALYNHCLRCLSLAYSGVGRSTQAMLVRTSIDLMKFLSPVASRLAQLPANLECPGITAGVSFATIRSSAALLGDVTSVGILAERLDEIAGRCERLGQNAAGQDDVLAVTRDGIAHLATRLKAHVVSAVERRAVAEDAERTVPPVDAEKRFDAASASDVSGDPSEVSAAGGPPQPIQMSDGYERIPGPEIDLIYSGKRCIHARYCVTGLPGVFIANVVGPWINPAAASTEELVTVAHMCPSGAIRYKRHDGGQNEQAPPVNILRVNENGPLALRAETWIDQVPVGTRLTLCRCGASANKPYCDGSHNTVKFRASGEPDSRPSDPLAVRGGPLFIEPELNGPLNVTGNLEVCTGTGRTVDRVQTVRLCRCGGSANKPFCDNSHRSNGFRS